jgi:hypothetical protein
MKQQEEKLINIDLSNYKNYTSEEIKKNVKDKKLKKIMLQYHRNRRSYLNNRFDENQTLKTHLCPICMCRIIDVIRHFKTKKHNQNELLELDE